MVSDKMSNICLYYLTKTGNNLVLHNLKGQKDTTTLEQNTNMHLVASSALDVEARKVITMLEYMVRL
jgi:hypothetical protein